MRGGCGLSSRHRILQGPGSTSSLTRTSLVSSPLPLTPSAASFLRARASSQGVTPRLAEVFLPPQSGSLPAVHTQKNFLMSSLILPPCGCSRPRMPQHDDCPHKNY